MSEIILITVVFCFHAITQSIFWWVVGNNCLKHAFMIHPYLGWLSLIDHFFQQYVFLVIMRDQSSNTELNMRMQPMKPVWWFHICHLWASRWDDDHQCLIFLGWINRTKPSYLGDNNLIIPSEIKNQQPAKEFAP